MIYTHVRPLKNKTRPQPYQTYPTVRGKANMSLQLNQMSNALDEANKKIRNLQKKQSE